MPPMDECLTLGGDRTAPRATRQATSSDSSGNSQPATTVPSASITTTTLGLLSRAHFWACFTAKS